MPEYITIDIEVLNKRKSEYESIKDKLDVDDLDNLNLLYSKIGIINWVLTLATKEELIIKTQLTSKLDEMESISLDGWTEEAIGGYISATNLLRDYLQNN